MSFGKFLTKHANELRSVANLFGFLVAALPVARSDKGEVENAIRELIDASNSIAKAAKTAETIKVTKADVEAAVKAVLPGLVAAAVAEALGNHPNAAVGNHNKPTVTNV